MEPLGHGTIRCMSAIFASTSLSPSALSALGPRREAAFSSRACSRIAACSSPMNLVDVLPIAVVLISDLPSVTRAQSGSSTM